MQTQQGQRDMPLDEAEYATSWCISIAQEIVDAQRAVATGKPLPDLELSTHWLVERFANLEAGLTSNGMAREKRTQGT